MFIAMNNAGIRKRLARRAGPDEIERRQIDRRIERVRLDEKIAAVSWLWFYVYPGDMESSALKPFSGPAPAAEQIERQRTRVAYLPERRWQSRAWGGGVGAPVAICTRRTERACGCHGRRFPTLGSAIHAASGLDCPVFAAS